MTFLSAGLAALHDLHFLRPQWLWALLALPLPAWLWWRARRAANVWRTAVDAHLLRHLLAGGGRRGWLGLAGLLLAGTLGVLALAGPSWQQDQQPLWQTRTPLVIALDLSPRVGASDLQPSRLLQARAKLASLLRERQGGQVGLVAFAGQPFTVAPLTDDAANVALFLDALDPEVMPVPGHDVGKAITWSRRLLEQAGFAHGRILVVTDQSDPGGEAAAGQARQAGFGVDVLGLGTEQGAAYRDPAGGFQRAQLDPQSLQRLAGSGGGSYRAITPDDSDLRALGVLDPQSADGSASKGQKALAWRDQGYWLLPGLMLLVLLGFRRGGALAALVLCAGLALPPQAQAATPVPAAGPPPTGSLWRRADQQAQQRLDAGTQAYRKGDFAAAQAQFEGLDSADGWYNLGNALARQGQYDQAIAAYDHALQHQPGMADALANRAAVEAARKRQPPKDQQQQQQQQQQKGSQGQSQPQGQQGGQQGQQGQQDKQGQQDQQGQQQDRRDQSRPQGAGKDQQAPQAQDAGQAQRQQAADQAQRQRMQQALQQQGKDGKEGAQAQAVPVQETAEQREHRQAVEAWLRRVPDDPGGLLRAKFQLEYERRQRQGQ